MDDIRRGPDEPESKSEWYPDQNNQHVRVQHTSPPLNPAQRLRSAYRAQKPKIV